MRNWIENQIRFAKHAALATAVIATFNMAYDRSSSRTYAQEPVPIPTPTPKPHRQSYWTPPRHIIIDDHNTLATIHRCGGERDNPENKQFVLVELLVDHVATGERPGLEIWNHQTSPPSSTIFPTEIESRPEGKRATLSKELPLGRYSFFVRRGENTQRIADQSIFECKPPYIVTE